MGSECLILACPSCAAVGSQEQLLEGRPPADGSLVKLMMQCW